MTGVLDRLDDNAMFYKDITQWLRNRTFGSLFFGLLLVAEAISVAVIVNEDRIGASGTFMYFTLYYVLLFYGVVIGSIGKNRTRQEYQSGTLDLFVLCGMENHKIVWGKILTLLYEFGFGFFCVAPFMFFAYFLGGLDFIMLITGCVAIASQLFLWYTFQLAAALSSRKPADNVFGILLVWVLWFFLFSFVLGPLVVGQIPIVKGLAEIGKEIITAHLLGVGKLILILIGYFVVFSICYGVCIFRIDDIGRWSENS